MRARILTGTKEQIAEQLAALTGQIREAIVFVDEPSAAINPDLDIFAEMESFSVRRAEADDSRSSIYEPGEGE